MTVLSNLLTNILDIHQQYNYVRRGTIEAEGSCFILECELSKTEPEMLLENVETYEDHQRAKEEKQNAKNVELFIQDETVIREIQQLLKTFTNNWSLVNSKDVETMLVYTFKEGWKFHSTATIESMDTYTDRIGEFYDFLINNSEMIDNRDDIRTSYMILSKQDEEWKSDEYTVNFVVDKPYEHVANCNSFEEYYELMANNEEEIEDIKNKEEYTSHTHLMGVDDLTIPNKIINHVVSDILNNDVSKNSESVIISPRQLTITNECTVELMIRITDSV